MDKRPNKYPSSEENLAPNGSEIMDAELTEEEVEEAVRGLAKIKTFWWLWKW